MPLTYIPTIEDEIKGDEELARMTRNAEAIFFIMFIGAFIMFLIALVQYDSARYVKKIKEGEISLQCSGITMDESKYQQIENVYIDESGFWFVDIGDKEYTCKAL